MEKDEILARVKKEKIKFINYQFTDMFGKVKSTAKPVEELAEALEKGVWFDGSSIEGFARIQESDSLLVPDLDTFAVLPWTSGDEKQARFICDVHVPTRDGTRPFEGDPRFLLKKQVDIARQMGYVYNTGPEVEFFIFKREKDGSFSPQDRGGYFDYLGDDASQIRKRISKYLGAVGIQVEMDHHEVAEGQHEIDIRYDNALQMADKVVTLKYTIRAAAKECGYFASFMPKPIFGVNGSGMHTHQSLFDAKGKNIFYDVRDEYKFSEIAYQFMAGQMARVRALSAIIAPTVNSYKRLVPGYEAPVYICWAQINRSALVRIPRYSVGREQSTRMELRCPDPSCNPYLAFAAMLASGLDGITKKLSPGIPLEENVYHLSDEEHKKRDIKTLPNSLLEALGELERDPLLMDVLGSHLGPRFLEAKLREWDAYRISVSSWEIEQYLNL